ncbi:hypothetical protein SISNIDRAFT_480593 [Sistotremastrum niveocremeum HHB9708]|uniref:Uncharacterized protein n=1 Tax=Sistotremastrum niveocremeum HHB9708 TaxID=1314777 RepID=A0A165AHL4_9AGAM|nr:hypothetical protein SISNIDRAFT_480593 [Sistotremastrum niveocremeum HHB9708]
MHRFRKKSDPKPQDSPHLRPQPPSVSPSPSPRPRPAQDVPSLPPVDDFRTSLILESLSRRFTLLRAQNAGSAEDMRDRPANRGATGSEQSILEEEEGMMLHRLNEIRSANRLQNSSSQVSLPQHNTDSIIAPSIYANSQYSASAIYDTSSSSSNFYPQSPSSGTSRRSKRNSNNLFSSGAARDQSYFRNAHKGSGRSLISLAQSDVSERLTDQDEPVYSGIRPITPDSKTNSTASSNTSETQLERTPVARKLNLPSRSAANLPPQSYSVNSFKRASLALNEVIREIQEGGLIEGGDDLNGGTLGDTYSEVGTPRTNTRTFDSAGRFAGQVLSESESSNSTVVTRSNAHSIGASPTPRIQGYTPGMNRPVTPVTPRDFDSEDLRSHSTTPRATSPASPSKKQSHHGSVLPGILRRGNSTANGRTMSPTGISPSPSPRPRSRANSVNQSMDEFSNNDYLLSSSKTSLHDRRRPASPLTSVTYAPQSAFRDVASAMREWSPTSSYSRPGDMSSPGHSRQGSLSSMHDQHTLGFHNRSQSAARSLTSPALPDSPLIDSSHVSVANMMQFSSSWDRPPSNVSGMDLGNPLMASRGARSGTPTYSHTRNGSVGGPFAEYDYNAMSAFRRSPKPQRPITPSSPTQPIIPYHNPLVLSPILNSSRTSFISTSSSYHSNSETSFKAFDAACRLIDIEPVKLDVIDISDSNRSTSGLLTSDSNAEDDVMDALKEIGLVQADFSAMQDKLVQAGSADGVVPKALNRVPSLRRRKNSITSRAHEVLNTTLNGIVGPPRASDSSRTALLAAVINSIESPSGTPPGPDSLTPASKPATPAPINAAAQVQNPEEESPPPSAQTDGSTKAASALQSLTDALFGSGSSALDASPAEDGPASPTSDAQEQDHVAIEPEVVADADASKQMFGEHAVIVELDDVPVEPTVNVVEEKPEEVEDVPAPVENSEQETQAPAALVDQPDQPVKESSPAQEETEYHPEPHVDASSSPSFLSSASVTPASTSAPTPDPSVARPNQPAIPEPVARTNGSAVRSPGNDPHLMFDVRRKATEATAALKSPSQPNLALPPARRKGSKRIDTHKISSPYLLSSSNSAGTVNLSSPSMSQVALPDSVRANSGGSKFSKILRGPWKPKSPTADDATSSPAISPALQLAGRTSPWPAASSSRVNIPASANEVDRFKLPPHPPLATPPASAGPTFKGLFGRFRKSRKEHDRTDSDRQEATSFSGSSIYPPPSSGYGSGSFSKSSPHDETTSTDPRSGPSAPSMSASTDYDSTRQQNSITSMPPSQTTQSPTYPSRNEENLKKLFDAATDLGVPHEELNAFLTRSASLSSKSEWATQVSSLSRSTSLATPSTTLSSSNTEWHQGDGEKKLASNYAISRANSARVAQSPVGEVFARTRNNLDASNANPDGNTVVRRTLIFPSESQNGSSVTDLSGLLRKASHRRRRASGASAFSGQSIQDRAPTPPPPKMKRFSTENSPPLPHSIASVMPSLSVTSPKSSTNPSEQSTTNTDSFYDMYANGGNGQLGSDLKPKHASLTPSGASSNYSPSEQGPAVEVLELSNGETIWSIVDGLRSGDVEDASTFQSRQSFSSEYSGPLPSPGARDFDGVQLRFKEHKRMSSKSSANSYNANPRKRALSPGPRPETKVFFSSNANIGKMIESMIYPDRRHMQMDEGMLVETRFQRVSDLIPVPI